MSEIVSLGSFAFEVLHASKGMPRGSTGVTSPSLVSSSKYTAREKWASPLRNGDSVAFICTLLPSPDGFYTLMVRGGDGFVTMDPRSSKQYVVGHLRITNMEHVRSSGRTYCQVEVHDLESVRIVVVKSRHLDQLPRNIIPRHTHCI